ncbi:hypothetical protein BB559_002269 [Furculomyces boomerangus]|uniref:CTLH domain-containing protein n=2 Tax=Harpellales TaxID=61421 RepID=A0A2T9YWN2_9FUNG|nr:hypothetical protein BB559_002269 [Furculomyces boomerangus]PWA00912.1 hypothetical protein BB558_003016 [Smittium angustum]
MDVESSDVIRLIQQYLKENNLLNTLEVLQKETGIGINAVESVENFKNDILKGRWDAVLNTVSQAEISPSKLIDLFEQIILELVELRELGAARSLLRQTEVMDILRETQQNRYLQLENIVSRTTFTLDQARKKREEIALELVNEISSVAPSRLLTLLNQSVKWQQSHGLLPVGSKIDLFKGVAVKSTEHVSRPVKQKLSTIKFPKGQRAECVAYSPDGHTLVTGSADGFVEVWNYNTGKLRKDLMYQAKNVLMMMEESVLSVAFANDGKLVASGSQNGQVKVWRLSDGVCIKRYDSVHSGGVLSLYFSNDKSTLLSSGFDHTIKIMGLKSGKIIREFRGHTSYVNAAVFTPDMTNVISGSSDGSIRIWEQSTGRCIQVLYPIDPKSALSIPQVSSLCPYPYQKEYCVLISNNTESIYLYKLDTGKIEKAFSVEDGPKKLMSAVFSHDCVYVYALGDNGTMYCFDFKTRKLSDSIKVGDLKHTTLVQNTVENTVSSFGNDRYVTTWS